MNLNPALNTEILTLPRLTAHRTAAVHTELVAQPPVALAALLRHLIPQALPEHFGYMSAPDYLALSGDNNHDGLLRAADDLPESNAWIAIEAQRARWVEELPAKRSDLLPWLIRQDPGTTLLDLLAFCTGTLLDGISGEEKPLAINALADTLNLDMTLPLPPASSSKLRYNAQFGQLHPSVMAASSVWVLEAPNRTPFDPFSLPISVPRYVLHFKLEIASHLHRLFTLSNEITPDLPIGLFVE